MSWVKKLKRNVKELIGGSKTYMPKNKSKGVLTDYAKKAAGGQFTGASGSDLAELKKKFGRK